MSVRPRKIVYLVAGAGSSYCGSCLRDQALATELRRTGYDLVLLPLYTPPRFDRPSPPLGPLMLGGISVYVLATYPWARRVPVRWWRLVDQPWILQRLGTWAPRTDPQHLGHVTVEFLRGLEGAEASPLREAARWIMDVERPDIVILPNLLLAPFGVALKLLAPHLKLLALAAGEEPFLEQLGETYEQEARRWMAHWVKHLDRIVTFSAFYRNFLCGVCGLPSEKISVIPLGIQLDGYLCQRDPAKGATSSKSRPFSYRLLYLSRIVPEKGLHLLAEAVVRLHRQGLVDRPVSLEVGGFLPEACRSYLQRCERMLKEAGLLHAWTYHGELTWEQKRRLLEQADLFVLPTLMRDSQSLACLEALASGTPIVVPASGWYPELVENTAAGVLFRSGSVDALTEVLRRLLQALPWRQRLAQQGLQAAREQLDSRRTVAALAACWESG
jgi:glycosyltransferase involved in cell wall biosynthesis